MTTAWIRAHRALPATTGTVVLSVLSLLTARSAINVGPGMPVRTTWFTLMGVVLLSGLPLYPVFGLLERTFARGRWNRFLRSGLTASLVWAAAVTVGFVAPAEVITWFVLLASLGLVAVGFTAERSWALVLVAGAGSITFDHMVLSSPVSAAMVALGLPLASCAYAVAWLVFLLAPSRATPSAA